MFFGRHKKVGLGLNRFFSLPLPEKREPTQEKEPTREFQLDFPYNVRAVQKRGKYFANVYQLSFLPGINKHVTEEVHRFFCCGSALELYTYNTSPQKLILE